MSEKASNLPAAASAEIPQPEQRQGILFAALWTLPLAVAVCCPFTYTTRAIASVIGLGLLLLAIGHTLYSATLHRVNATLVNLIATQEIAGGILLGIWLLGEYPDFNTLIGILLVL